MSNLIWKDFAFAKKWVFIAVLYAVLVPIVLIVSNEQEAGAFFTVFLVPFFCVSLPLGKILNVEDDHNARRFLKILPYSAYQKVGARTVFVSCILIVVEIYQIVIDKLFLNPDGLLSTIILQNVLVFFLFLTYFLLYMLFYYWKSYYVCQYCIYICVFLVAGLSYVSKNSNMNINFQNLSNPVLITIAVIVNAILFFSCCEIEKRRKIS